MSYEYDELDDFDDIDDEAFDEAVQPEEVGGDQDKIDFVIAWVDGNDPAWRAEKDKYDLRPSKGSAEVRFRDWNNLRYWFRGVEKFAPWVRKVHFVTW